MPISLARHITMPFPYRKNGRYEAIARKMQDGLIRHRLIRPDQREYHRGFNLLNAFFFPRVSRRRLLTLSKAIDFFFLCDDIYDTTLHNGRDEDLVEELLTVNVQIIESGKLPPNPDPLNRFADEMIREIRRLQTDHQRQRLARAIGDYLLGGSLRLMRMWAHGEMPDIATYRAIRQFDVAMYPTIEISELAGKVSLPPQVHRHDILRRMRHEANLQVAMANDLLSYPKEVLRDRCPYNMVQVVSAELGVPLERAAYEVIDMVNGHTRAFLDLGRQLPSWDKATDRTVGRYVRGMIDLMAGNWYWSFACSRYSSADSPFLELRTTEQLLEHKSRGLLATAHPKVLARRMPSSMGG